MSVLGRPLSRGRLTPAEPLGDGMLTRRPVSAPVTAGVGIDIPERGDPCCVQWYAIQKQMCDRDDPDPLPMTPRQLSVPDAPT